MADWEFEADPFAEPTAADASPHMPMPLQAQVELQSQVAAELFRRGARSDVLGAQEAYEVYTTITTNRQRWNFRIVVRHFGTEMSGEFPALYEDKSREINAATDITDEMRHAFAVDVAQKHVARRIDVERYLASLTPVRHSGVRWRLLAGGLVVAVVLLVGGYFAYPRLPREALACESNPGLYQVLAGQTFEKSLPGSKPRADQLRAKRETQPWPAWLDLDLRTWQLSGKAPEVEQDTTYRLAFRAKADDGRSCQMRLDLVVKSETDVVVKPKIDDKCIRSILQGKSCTDP